MEPIAILALLVFGGIGTVFFLLKNEGRGEVSVKPISPNEISSSDVLERAGLEAEKEKVEGKKPKEKKSLFGKFLKKKDRGEAKPQVKKPSSGIFGKFGRGKFGKGKKGKEVAVPEATSFQDLLGDLEVKKDANSKKETLPMGPPPAQTGTASITTTPPVQSSEETLKEKAALSEADEKKIEEEIHVNAELQELKEKYDKLDSLFKEKGSELDKAQNSLENEQKNRKEFNKVKDLLEKELSDIKDRSRKTHVELNATKAESEGFKKRVNQLEGKCTQLEKELIEKDEKIDELVKRIQTFASPTTAGTPPAKEDKPAEQIQETPEEPKKESRDPQTTSAEQKEPEPQTAEQTQEPPKDAATDQSDKTQTETEKEPKEEPEKESAEPAKTETPSPEPQKEQTEPNQETEAENADSESDSSGPDDSSFLKLQPDVLDQPESTPEKPSQEDNAQADKETDQKDEEKKE